MSALALLLAADASTSLLTDVRWNWDWSPWATVLILAAATAWVAGVYLKEQRFVSGRMRSLLAVLRLIAVGIVLTMLAQPTIERLRVAPPRLVMLLDDSASMDTRDIAAADVAAAQGATGNVTRLEAWERILGRGERPLFDELRSRYEVEVVRFATDAELVPTRESEAPALPKDLANGNRDSTHLGDAIDYALRQLPGVRPAAIVAMTDGVNTAGTPLRDAAARARTRGVPLYSVALGSDRPRPDVSLDDVLVEEVVFPGDRLQIEATVRSAGFAGKETRIVLKRAGAEEVLAETPVKLPADGAAETVRLALRPTDPGPMRVELQVDSQPGEDDVANNRAELTIDVRDRPIRALLVDSTPSFEYRALKSLLERDPAIDLRVLLQDADAEFASVDDAALRDFPTTEAELLEYDVVLLGDVDPQLMPRQTWELLERFVSMHGGGLVLIAGRRFMPHAYADIDPMRTLLPLDAQAANAPGGGPLSASGVRIVPTPLGLQDPSLQLGETLEASAAIWAELPPVLWTLDPVRPKPGVQILAVGVDAPVEMATEDSLPIIMRHYLGTGEVLMHGTDETWRWRWRNDDRFFARYWGQAVRRLARGRALRGVGSLTTNRAEYRVGAPVTIRLRLAAPATQADDAQYVDLAGDSTPTRQVRLPRKGSFAQMYETTLRDLPADRFTARVAADGDSRESLRTEFVVASPPGELAQLVVNVDGLREAARTTGGRIYTAKTAGDLREELPPAKPTAVERLPDEPLWNSHWLLAALCVTLGSEWLIRRRVGML